MEYQVLHVQPASTSIAYDAVEHILENRKEEHIFPIYCLGKQCRQLKGIKKEDLITATVQFGDNLCYLLDFVMELLSEGLYLVISDNDSGYEIERKTIANKEKYLKSLFGKNFNYEKDIETCIERNSWDLKEHRLGDNHFMIISEEGRYDVALKDLIYGFLADPNRIFGKS